MQVIAPQLTVPLAFHDLRALPRSRKRLSDTSSFRRKLLHSFDLAKGPLIRARLVRLAEQEHLLLISMHQVICDGWSLGVFVEELVTLYDAFSAGRDRRWRRSRSSTRTLRTGSGTGGRIRKSLHSSHTGESSFAIRCP